MTRRNEMTTSTTATLLPRREHSGPTPGADALFSVPVVGGYASDGEPAGALWLWAHARNHDEVEFDLHRHEALEILTVVLDGTMSHYDTATDRWAELHAGDAQMIHAGSGISHIERSGGDSRGFQIQFDPGYDAALQREPSYTDYPAASFTARQVGEAQVTEFVGGDGPIEARTEGLSARRITLPAGSSADVEVGPGRFTLVYVIIGAATVNGVPAAIDDAISLHEASAMSVDATAATDLFVISTAAKPTYQPRRMDPREQHNLQGPGRH